MKQLLHDSRLQFLIKHRNGYLTLAVGSLMVNVMLGLIILVIAGNQRVILVPPSINKTFWVSKNKVSAEYLSEMGFFIADLRLTVSPGNAKIQREMLLRYVDPALYASLKTELLSEENHLQKEHLTTVFYPVDILVDEKKSLVKITGDLQSSIGEVALPTKRLSYVIHFSYHQGRLLVKSFEEMTQHA